MSLMGRTSFILTIILLLFLILRNIRLRQFTYLLVISLGLSFMVNPSIEYLLNQDDLNNQVFQYVQIAQVLLGQISIEETAYLYDLLETLKTFFIFPSNTLDLFLGAGLSGRESTYIKSDMGWVLNIYSFGLLGISIFTFLHMYLLYLSKSSKIFEPILFITIFILFLNFKENLFFVRHASLVFFLCLIYISYPIRSNNPYE